jgi:hypothetical protein
MKHVSEPLTRPRTLVPDLPDDVERVIVRALAKRPADRYQSMAAFAQELENMRATPARPTIATRSQRRPLGLALLAGGCMLGTFALGAAVVLVLLVNRDATPPPADPAMTATVAPTARSARTGVPPSNLNAPTATLDAVSSPPVPTETATQTPSSTEIPTETSTPAPRFYAFSACAQECNGSNSSLSFPAGATLIYATWNYENIPIGAAYERSWSVNGNRWIRYACAWPGPVTGVDHVVLREPGQLFSGTWELTISINGQILMREQVLVEGNVTYWAPAGELATCY